MAHVTLLNFPAESLIPDSIPIQGGDGMPTLIHLRSAWFLAFDDAVDETVITPRVIMPGQFAGGTLKITFWGCFQTEEVATDEAAFETQVESITQGDGIDISAASSFAAIEANPAEIDPPANAGDEASVSYTLANDDGAAAGDFFRVLIRRTTSHGSDTATDDFYLGGIEIWEDV